MPACFQTLTQWRVRNWAVAVISGLLTMLIIAFPTAMIETPVFGRAVAVTNWAWLVLWVTAVFTGLLIGSYISVTDQARSDRELKIGTFGGVLGFLAVGCPVCNKLALIALGSTGAMTYFAPVQPYLAATGIFLLAYALRVRLQNQSNCKLPNQNLKRISFTTRRDNGNN